MNPTHQPNYRIYDADFWLDIPWEARSTIRVRPLYHRLMNLLRTRGFHVDFDPFGGNKGYRPRSWNWQDGIGRCGHLYFAAQMHESLKGGKANPCAGHIEIKFWQNQVLEKGRTDGRHAFQRIHLMPYLIRLHFQLTVQKIIAFLHEIHPGTFIQDHSTIWPSLLPRVGYDYLMHCMSGWKYHLPREGYDPFTFLPGSNYGGQYLADALGQPIVPGQMYKAYAGYSHHRLIQGRAVYSFNGNWLLYANNQSAPGYAYHNQLYPLHTPLPRRRKCSLKEQISKASEKLNRLMKAHQFEQCISTRDFLRRHS